MKKHVSYALTSLLLLASLVGCGGQQPAANNSSQETASSSNSGGNEKASGSTSQANSASPSEASSITISMGSVASSSPDSQFQQFLEKFKEEVEKNSQGKIKIEIHPNGELGGDREMIEGVQLGTLDGVISSSAVLGNFTSLVNVFDFPFLFRDRQHAYNVLDGELGTEVAKQIESSGLKLLVWAENGFRNITNSKHPVRTPEDMKGLKIRTQENKVIVESFAQFGSDPTPMSFTELFTALQQGVVDGQENPLAIIVSSKLYEVQKHITLSNHIYQAAPVTINKAKFESLSPEYQKIIQDAAIVARDYERDFIAKKNDEFLKTLQDNGMEIVKSEDFDREAFVTAAAKVYESFGNEYGDFIQRVKDTK